MGQVGKGKLRRTNSDWLDLDTLLNMRCRGIIRILVLQNFLSAKSIDKSSSAWQNQSDESRLDGKIG